MKKNGFTLVELLAVIAILAILVIIALPNIMSLFNNAKKESFTNEIKVIVKTAEQQWMNDSMFDTQEIVYSRVTSEECPKSLKLSGRSQLNYYIKVNKAGKIVEYYAEDGTYQYSYNGQGLKIEEIDGVLQISNINDNQKITISCGGVSGGSGSSGGSSATNIATCVTEGCNKTAKETELVIGGENFYVVSSNENETVLLAKYDLKSDGSGSYTQDTSGRNTNIIKANFLDSSNTAYWDSKKCVYSSSWSCPSSNPSGLISPYNANGASYCTRSSGTNCAYVYDSNAVNIYPVVNKYAEKISSASGASMTGKLMSLEEANSLSSNVRYDKNGYHYWLGSANSYGFVWLVYSSGGIYGIYAYDTYGLRPVLIVSTSAL